MNAMKNLAHYVVLAVLAIAGVLFSLKILFAGAFVPALFFWAWFAGYAALTSFITSNFKSPLGALATHGVVLLVLSMLPRFAPFSALRLGLDVLI